MFNILLSAHELFLISLISFFIFLTIRQLFLEHSVLIFLYHIILCFPLFIVAVGGGGVLNDGYSRLNQFIQLEQNNELESARNKAAEDDSMLQVDLKSFNDSMLQIDLKSFKNSAEFREYLAERDLFVDKAEAMFIGWFLAFVVEISMLCVKLINYVLNRIRNIQLKL